MAENGKNGERRTMEKEIDIFQMYLDEMEMIESCSRDENAALVIQALEGDRAAKKRLVEGNLKHVLGISRDYVGRGLPVPDLVQEANMALVLAVEELALAGGMTFEAFLDGRVREMLELAAARQEAEDRGGALLAEQVNLLQDVSKDMAEELGREPKPEELARRLKITEDEVRDIMKMALDAVNVMNQPAMPESFGDTPVRGIDGKEGAG